MSEGNVESKLQRTISMMQEINSLVSDTEGQSQTHKDEASTKESILQLKQNIMNQHETDFGETLNRLENPPMITIKLGNIKMEIIDQDILKELKEQFSIAQTKLEISKSAVVEAKSDVLSAKSQMVEKDQVKNILESELEQLYNEVSSLLHTVRNEQKSALKNMAKDKELVKNERDINPTENKAYFESTEDEKEYFKTNLHVTEFNKALDGSAAKTSHMSIEAVGED
jgi:hypothetical protein